MANRKPSVSVVMTVFNEDKYVSRAIESILNQTLKNFEFIIVNDASSDKSLSVIRSYMRKDKRIRLINNRKNLKLPHSLNLGVSQAKANFIARMDADDIALPKRLQKECRFLKTHPNVAIVGSNILIVDEEEHIVSKREYSTNSVKLKQTMLRYSPFAHPSVMFRKDIFEEFGGYNKLLNFCEDIDYWFRIGTTYEFGNIPEFLLRYTLKKNSVTHANLHKQELLGFKVKINAILNYGYRPTFYDIVYNIAQFVSLWFMPTDLRIKFYNALRSRNLI